MKFVDLLKDKRFRYGTMSTAMMVFAVVIFVLVNILADEFNRSWDLTDEQLYSLTTQSERFLEELDMDITLYHVVRTGAGDEINTIVTQLLAEYAANSPHITVEIRDPMINPTFVHQFAAGVDGGVPEGSVIVQGARGFRVVTPADMETFGINPQTWQRVRESIDVERSITQAIHALTRGEPHVIYHITGSGEHSLPQPFVEFLESENFVMREHNAVTHDVPETADALFITMPPRDWSTAKADRILDYLDNQEGRVFMALNIALERFPQLNRVLNAYGLDLGDYLIIEGNQGRTFMQNPMWIMPMWEPHEAITFPLILDGFTGLLFLEPTGLEVAPILRPSLIIEPLFTSTRDSYGRHVDNAEAGTIMQVPEDAEGPFNLAVAVTDSVFIDTTRTTKLVVVSNTAILIEEVNNTIGGSNWAFISNSLNWMQDQPAGVWVPPRRPPGGVPLTLSDAQVFAMSGTAMGVLPILTFGIGIFIWFRRRHN